MTSNVRVRRPRMRSQCAQYVQGDVCGYEHTPHASTGGARGAHTYVVDAGYLCGVTPPKQTTTARTPT